MTTHTPTHPRDHAWEETLKKTILVIARITLAYLFFTQLFWKWPPTFGCPPDFSFTTAAADGKLQRSKGLCDWIGVESVWASRARPILVADMKPIGGPKLSLGIGWAAQLNGLFIDNVVKPNIRWFGWVIWGSETFIFVSLLLGLLSRLGGLVAIGMSAQLLVGLAGISSPFEWEWTYNLMVIMSLLVFAFAPGRIFGVDAWLRPKLQATASRKRLAGLLLWLT